MTELALGDEPSLENAIVDNSKVYCGVVFTDSSYTDSQLPASIVYKIRLHESEWETGKMFPSEPIMSPSPEFSKYS